MRGQKESSEQLFYYFDLEGLVASDHPLRRIRELADAELNRMGPVFAKAYAGTGRPSIPPEYLLKAMLLQALYSIRSERQLCEQIGYNMLFRWFLGLSPSDPVWNPTSFTKNRDRFAEHGLVQRFFEGSVAAAIASGATDTEHFSVDGSLIQSWASMKSVVHRDAEDDEHDSNTWSGFKGEKRTNDTHVSKTDPEARLARRARGTGAQLSHSAHVLMENRNGLCMGVSVAEASGEAEREEAIALHRQFKKRHAFLPRTTGMDKGYDAGPFLQDMEESLGVTPHVAIRKGPLKATDPPGLARKRASRRQRTKGYRVSQRSRKKAEQIFGWIKTVAHLRRTRFVGRWKTRLAAYIAATAYNFMRLSRLATA